jgi:uncharacterized protein YqgQ
VRALYSHYGTVENIEQGVGFDIMLEGLRRDIVTREVGENEYHDVPVWPDMPWDKLMEALWEERVLVKIEPAIAVLATIKTPLVDYAMIREDVWQRLLRVPIINTFTDNTLRIKHFRKEIRKLYSEALAHRDDSVRIKEIMDKAGQPDFDFDQAWEDFHHPLASLGLQVQFVPGVETHWRLLVSRGLPIEQVEGILDSIAELGYLTCMLANLGHQWRPSTTYGMQHGDFRFHTQFLQALAQVGNKLAKEQEQND